MKRFHSALPAFALFCLVLFTATGFVSCSPDQTSLTYPWDADPAVEFSEIPASTTTDPYFGALRTITPDNPNSLATDKADWYKDAIFYHLWVPAFADSNGDGIGDLQGIIDHLDYLQNDLGVTAIWLSPIFESASTPPNLHGYDAINLYRVDPRLGSNYRLQQLIRALHSRGMRIIFDYVPNHVSSQHPWFTKSASGTGSPYRDWLIWKPNRPTGWTGWDSLSDFHGPVNGSYYYGLFWDGMPDLNYETQAVREAMANILLGWLNFGFDGIRVDAVKYLYEDWSTTGSGYVDQAKTIEHWQKVRELLNQYTDVNTAKFMVAENWTGDQSNLLEYMAKDGKSGFNMTLDFPFAYAAAALNTADLNNHWMWVQSSVVPAGGWMGTFTSNHDNVVSRPSTKFSGDAGKVRLQAALQLTGLGTPFIYYGNEIGMAGAAGNDINLRQPFSWNAARTQKTDPSSLLSWHRALIVLRSARSSLRQGSYLLVANSGGVFAYERNLGSERTLVVMNTTAEACNLSVTLSSAPSAVHTLFGSDNVSWTSGSSTITLNNVAGFGVRVLALESGVTGATLINDIPYQIPPAPSFYLMGTLSDWSSGAAMAPVSGASGLLSVSRPLNANIAYLFKFKSGGTWYGWNELGSKYDTSLADSLSGTAVNVSLFQDDGSVNHNIKFTPESGGTYRFLYRYTDQRWCVVRD